MRDRFDENNTYVPLPRGVDCHSGLRSFQFTPTGTAHLVFIDWLPACIAKGQIVPATQFKVWEIVKR